jgi:hypothetical protein
LNIALFHKAARVEELTLPAGTEIQASTGHMEEDGWKVDFSVTESTPPGQTAGRKDDDDNWLDLNPLASSPWTPGYPDSRKATLRIDLNSIKVQVVDKVELVCREHSVRRHRREKVIPELRPGRDVSENFAHLL